MRCLENTSFDFDLQVQDVRLRFEVVLAGEVIEREESEQRLRWYTQEEFARLLAEAGFNDIRAVDGYTWQPARGDSASFVFVAN